MPSVSPSLSSPFLGVVIFFSFNDTATTEIYTLSLHDALPIYARHGGPHPRGAGRCRDRTARSSMGKAARARRSEEHTSELQSRRDLVCRLLLEKKKKNESPVPVNMYPSTSTPTYKTIFVRTGA